MRTYCLVAFWLLCIGLLHRMACIVSNEYPRVVTYKSAAEDVMWLIISLGFFVWLGVILWGWL
jgi:hypothetical protein